MTDTLGDALPREIKRVREKKERWIGYAADMEKMSPGSSVGMKLTMRLMDRRAQMTTAKQTQDLAEVQDARRAIPMGAWNEHPAVQKADDLVRSYYATYGTWPL